MLTVAFRRRRAVWQWSETFGRRGLSGMTSLATTKRKADFGDFFHFITNRFCFPKIDLLEAMLTGTVSRDFRR